MNKSENAVRSLLTGGLGEVGGMSVEASKTTIRRRR
jgi:hypothetical protein